MSEHPSPAGAATIIDRIADGGSFEPWDVDVVSGDPLTFVDTRPYPDRLADAADLQGRPVLTGADAWS